MTGKDNYYLLEKIVLDNIKDFLCVVFDDNGNILYPKDADSLKRYSKIIRGTTDTDGMFYLEETDEFFELYTTISDLNGKKILLNYFRNISRFKRFERELQVDFTGIANRKSAIKKIDEYIQYALDNDVEFCVSLSDIDYFKRINDTYGHLFGDVILKDLGLIINENIRKNPGRETDIVGRFGGDEFFGLIKNISLENSIKWRDKSQRIFSDYVHKSNDGTIALTGVSISIGIKHINHAELDKLKKSRLSIDDIRKYIFDKCDENLYENKAKNHFTIDMREYNATKDLVAESTYRSIVEPNEEKEMTLEKKPSN